MPPGRKQRAAGGEIDDERAERLTAREAHKVALPAVSACDPGTRAAVDALFGEQGTSARAVGDAVGRFAAKDATKARDLYG